MDFIFGRKKPGWLGIVLLLFLAMTPIIIYRKETVHSGLQTKSVLPEDASEENRDTSSLANAEPEQQAQPATTTKAPTTTPQSPSRPTLPKPCIQSSQFQFSRTDQIMSVCKAFNMSTNYINKKKTHANHMYVDDSRKMITCMVLKAGSTIWRYLLIATNANYLKKNGDALGKRGYVSAGAKAPNNNTLARYGIRRLTSYTQEEADYRIKHYYKMIFIRHPLDRLVSAYRNKMQMKDKLHNFTIHAVHKINKLRGVEYDQYNQFPEEFSWSEFVNHVIQQSRIRTVADNTHWNSMDTLCAPCGIQYDHVAKLENFVEEGACPYSYFTGGKESKLPPMRKTHKSADNTQMGANTQGTVHSFYKDLSSPQMIALQKIYHPDCLMFGYNCDKYSSV